MPQIVKPQTAQGDYVSFRWRLWTALPFDENLALYAIAVPVALFAIYTMIVAGHSGATLVWKTNR